MLDILCLVQMCVQYAWLYMYISNECSKYLLYIFSSNEGTIYFTPYVKFKWMYNIIDCICLVHMSVQYTWLYMFSSNEGTIYLTVYVQFKWGYNILDCICLVQMSVQYTWLYMFSSNECTIYLTVYV